MKTVIVLGGELPPKAFLCETLQEADYSIAADRGMEAFAASGRLPDLWVGDMDSIDPSVLNAFAGSVQMHRLSCIKDDTDGVDALDVAIQKGATEIVLLGALGGRLDHALANLMLLVRAHRKNVWAEIQAPGVSICRVNGRCMLENAQGDTVSLLPLGTAEGVTVKGCFYPLSEGVLRSDHPLGISNVVTEPHAEVRVTTGDLILFHYQRNKH